MEAVLLRTLTIKSKIGFGKYHYCTVGDLLKIPRYRYLRWVYYNIAGISFTPDILSEIGVLCDGVYDHRIDKPGTDPHIEKILYEKKNKEFIGIKDRSHREWRDKKIKKQRLVQINRINYSSKSQLQAINQGKY